MIENGIWVDLGNKRENYISSKMLKIMRSLKADLESIKVDNENLLKKKEEHEEINDFFPKSLTENRQTKIHRHSSSNANKEPLK